MTTAQKRDARLAQIRSQIMKYRRDQRACVSPNVAITLIDRLRAAERVVAAADAWCDASPIKTTPNIPELKALVDALQEQETLLSKLEEEDDHTVRSEDAL
jgi:type II secretory pathway pseudopilin PulG